MGYWEIPEGTECVKKTWLTTRVGAALGLVGSAYHIVAFQPNTALQGLQRAATGTISMATLGAIFGLSTCLSAQIREKPDDAFNYFVGGCASGIFLGVKTHNYMTGTTACLALGTIAALTKIGKKEGWVLIPSEPKL